MAPRSIGPLPPPSPDFDRLDLPILELAAPLTRIHRLARDPAHWGRTGDQRFDAPSAEFGVLYASLDDFGAFIETCGDTAARTVTMDSLAAKGWALVEPRRPLRIADLSGAGLARIGADERLCAGDHGASQPWSLAIWRHPAAVDGLQYRARRDPSRLSVAVFDRAAAAVSVRRSGGLVETRHRERLGEILDHYQFAVI